MFVWPRSIIRAAKEFSSGYEFVRNTLSLNSSFNSTLNTYVTKIHLLSACFQSSAPNGRNQEIKSDKEPPIYPWAVDPMHRLESSPPVPVSIPSPGCLPSLPRTSGTEIDRHGLLTKLLVPLALFLF